MKLPALVPRQWAAAATLLFTLGGCGDPDEPPAPEAPWVMTDLWGVAPTVEAKPARIGHQRGWRRTTAPLGVAESRELDRLTEYQQQRFKSLPASEVHVLEQSFGTVLRWRLELGEQPYLSLVPLRPEDEDGKAAAEPGPSPRYRVRVRPAGVEETAVREGVGPPPRGPGPGAAQGPVIVDLEPWAGASIDLLLEVLPPDPPGRDGPWPRARWASPTVYSRRATASSPEGSSPKGNSELPMNVLLIGADTLRADALGAYGAQPSVTPALDRLAAQSDLWLDAVSCFNVTNPSFVSLMTGLYGKNHGVYDLRTSLAPEQVTLAEIFSAADYDTAAVISARHLGDHNSGLGQGFDQVLMSERQYAAELAVNLTLEWIDARDGPFFAWLHLFDPHTPHTPPEPYALGYGATAAVGLAPEPAWFPFRAPGPVEAYADPLLAGHRDLYTAEVAYLDRQIDRLLGFLESRGLLETTLVVFTADHGENLEEHGSLFTHFGLYESTTRVPLMIRWPGAATQGRRIPGLVQNVDLFPTLLEAAGLESPDPLPIDGEPLQQLTGEGRRGRRVALSEHAHRYGVRARTERYAYMVSNGNRRIEDGAYLFDLQADPEEHQNLAGTGLAIEDKLARILQDWLRQRRPTARPTPVNLSEEDRQRLEALGYLD